MCGVQDGLTPLLLAAEHGHIVVVKKLLAAGANVNVESQVCTALRSPPLTAPTTGVKGDGASHHSGVSKRRTRCVWGAQNEVAPLSIAARHGHIVITKKLLAAGADVNAQSEVRTSPLTASTTQGSPPPPPSEACPSSAASASAASAW